METLTPVLLPLFVLWGMGLLLIVFRRGLGASAKISALLIFLFYGLWFLEPTLASFELYRSNLRAALPALIGIVKNLLALGLFVAWPFALFAVFRMGSADQAAGLLRGLVLWTLLFWLLWILNYFLGPVPEEWLMSILPERMSMPDIPPPPVRPQ